MVIPSKIMNNNKLILASASPRRLELLMQVGVVPDEVIHPNISEEKSIRESPSNYALRVAKEKVYSVSSHKSGFFIIGADTVVSCGRDVLPKAENIDQARNCLQRLSGRRHRVLTGVAVISPKSVLATAVVETRVRFKRLTDEEVQSYLIGGEWKGKAGGYAIQGFADSFVVWINGSYSNIVGLPLNQTKGLLNGLGWKMHFSKYIKINKMQNIKD